MWLQMPKLQNEPQECRRTCGCKCQNRKMNHRNAGEHMVANAQIAKWTTGMPENMWLQMPKLQNGPLFLIREDIQYV